jgi:HK97 gp10 family phage protein
MASGNFNHFPAIADALYQDLKKAVKETAEGIQTDARSLVPVDTGFLFDSIYVAAFDSSDYGSGGFGGEHQELFPEVETPPDEFTAYVAVGATYGEFVEYGTIHMAPEPFFTPAVMWGEGELEDELARIVADLEDAFP